jgi:hypothetical protein
MYSNECQEEPGLRKSLGGPPQGAASAVVTGGGPPLPEGPQHITWWRRAPGRGVAGERRMVQPVVAPRHARRARTQVVVRFAAGCWVQCCPSQSSGHPWPFCVYDVFWLLSFGLYVPVEPL